jgi:hypothetical protein
MPVSAPVSSRSRGAATAGLVVSVSALVISRAWAAGRVLPLVARHEPGPGVVPRAQAFAVGVSYPRLAVVAACAAAVARRWPPCRRRWQPTTASLAWLGDIRVVEVSHPAGDVHGPCRPRVPRRRSWRCVSGRGCRDSRRGSARRHPWSSSSGSSPPAWQQSAARQDGRAAGSRAAPTWAGVRRSPRSA